MDPSLYCRKLFAVVVELRDENAKLRLQHDRMITTVKEIRSSVITRLQQQKADVGILHKTFNDYHYQFESLMADARSNFDVQTSNSAELIKHMAGDSQFVREQLNIKRVRYNALNKAHVALNKKHSEMKLRMNKTQVVKKSQTVLRCIRCKARKNVITCLENDLTDKMKEAADAKRKLETLGAEHKSIKADLQAAKRKLCEVEDKLKEETKKVASASSTDSTPSCVEVTRTPGGDSPPSGNSAPATSSVAADHSKCEKEIISLQWSINSKASELVRVSGQLKTIREENANAIEQASFYRCRSEHLMSTVKDLTANLGQLERRLADTTQEMTYFRNRYEQQVVQLQQLNGRVDVLSRDLVDSEQGRETLRVLLTNLASSVSASLFNG